MSQKRKQNSAQFKAKAALASLQNDETTAQLASRFDVHPTMISAWKRQQHSCLSPTLPWADGRGGLADQRYRFGELQISCGLR
jgi:hypothetical protein